MSRSAPSSRSTTWPSGPGSIPQVAETILDRPAAEVLDPATGGDDPDWAEWRRRFHDHLERFGHAVYNLDFANAVPADAPAPLLDTLRFYLRGQGADPADRRRRSADRREKTAAAVAARLDPIRRAGFERLLRRAQEVAPGARGRAGRRRPGLAAAAADGCWNWAGGWWPAERSAGPRTSSGCIGPRSPIPVPDSPTRSNGARRSGAVSGGPPRRSCCPRVVRWSSRCGDGCRRRRRIRSAT